MSTYAGSCHCGAIQFEFEATEPFEVERCNCSICKKSGFLHLILPLSQFRVLKGADQLSEYRFNTGVAKHLFCKTCGIKPYYVPRSNPDGISINLNCVDTPINQVIIADFDGQNWEQHAHTLSHKTQG